MTTTTTLNSPYIGRFAPTPSGALHLGSLVAAVASYLDARAAGGQWLVRIEDVDHSRSQARYITQQLHSLTRHGLVPDGAIRQQSRHLDDYFAALQALRPHLYPCDCSRAKWHAVARSGVLGAIYPNFCRAKTLSSLSPDSAIRLRLPAQQVQFVDRCVGCCAFTLQQEIGDPIVRRRDGDFAYALAVVVDDALQGVTDVVRGQDLLAATAIQLVLQQLLHLPRPRYLHFSLLTDANGRKLSKQNHAPPLNDDTPAANLLIALQFLGQNTAGMSAAMPITELLAWAITRWQIPRLEAKK